MPRTKRGSELAKYAEGEARPQRCRLFRHEFIKSARVLAASGVTSDMELATFYNVSPSSVASWRKSFPEFARAINGGALDARHMCANTVLSAAADGSTADAKWWMEKTIPEFKPSSKITLDARVDNLASVLERRAGTSDAALIAAGIIIDVEE